MTPTNPTLEGIFTQLTGNDPSPISPNAPFLDRLCGVLMDYGSATFAMKGLLTKGDMTPDALYDLVVKDYKDIDGRDKDQVRVEVNKMVEVGVMQIGQDGYLSLSSEGEQLAKTFFAAWEIPYHPKYQNQSE